MYECQNCKWKGSEPEHHPEIERAFEHPDFYYYCPECGSDDLIDLEEI